MLQIKIFINGQDATNRDNKENAYVSHIQGRLAELRNTNKALFDKFPKTEVVYQVTQNGAKNKSVISMVGNSNAELQDLLQSVFPE